MADGTGGVGGGGGGSPDFAALNAQYSQVSEELTDLQSDIQTLKTAGGASADQIQRMEASAAELGRQLQSVGSAIISLQAHLPTLPTPGANSGSLSFQPPPGAGDASSAEWLNAAIAVLLAILSDIAQAAAEYRQIESQNVAEGMIATDKMGQAQAKNLEEIGHKEMLKGMLAGSTMILGGSLSVGSSLSRGKKMKSEAEDPAMAKQKASVDAEVATNQKTASRLEARNAEIDDAMSRNQKVGAPKTPAEYDAQLEAAGGRPEQVVTPRPPASGAEMEAMRKERAANQTEIDRVNARSEQVKGQYESDRQRRMYQEMELEHARTQGISQITQGISQVATGIFDMQIKGLEADNARIAAQMSVLQQFVSQSSKQSESAAQDISAATQLMKELADKNIQATKFGGTA